MNEEKKVAPVAEAPAEEKGDVMQMVMHDEKCTNYYHPQITRRWCPLRT